MIEMNSAALEAMRTEAFERGQAFARERLDKETEGIIHLYAKLKFMLQVEAEGDVLEALESLLRVNASLREANRMLQKEMIHTKEYADSISAQFEPLQQKVHRLTQEINQLVHAFRGAK